jgi:anti-sigma regulatory factor (Ser/Thr protein kinase)
MRTNRFPRDARWATSARRPWSPPRSGNGSDRRAGGGLGPGRPILQPFPGDEVALESDLVLENDTALIPPLLARLHERADRLELFDAGTADRVAVALTEALLNGILHGNLELDSRLREEDEATYERMSEFRRRWPPYRDRRLHVRARFSRREAVYVIRDEGPGFDPSTLPDPTDPAHLERTTGRGLLLIRAYMDAVAFNPTGNQITLTKRSTTTPDARGL